MKTVRNLSLASLLLAAASLFAFLGAAPAAATPNDKLDLNCDVGACNPGSPLDMDGPVVGFVNYNQAGGSGDLRLVVKIDDGSPNTTYTVYLVCGTTHATACGFDDFATVTTNGQGKGNTGAIIIPKCEAQALLSLQGPDMLGHVDILNGDSLAATTIDFDPSIGPDCGPVIAPAQIQSADPTR